jgi:hypothetical protein
MTVINTTANRATQWKVIVDGLVASWHRTEAAADRACLAIRRSGRAKWGSVHGIAYVEKA